MKSIFTFLLLAVTFSVVAQNQITTPTGQPLVIGNQGVKLSNLNSSTPTQATNGKVLTVDANGLLFLAPDESGTPSQWTNNAANIFFNTGNVGLGTNDPLQRLHVNGDINIPSTNAFRINNATFLSAKGNNNILLGPNLGGALTVGAGNIFIGNSSGISNTSGNDNFFMGTQAGKNNTTGRANIFIGPYAGRDNVVGEINTYIGTNAGQQSNGNYNVAIGYSSGIYATSNLNMFIGFEAGKGTSAAVPNSGGSNTFIGYQSGKVNSTGYSNLALGISSGNANTAGYRNVFLGAGSGTTNTTGYQNTLIGTSTNVSTPNLNNATAIGYGATVSQSNSLVLGSFGVAVGIGNSAPTARLHLTAGGTIGTGVRFENLPTATGTIFNLFVDSNGNLMRSSSAGARESAENNGNWTLTASNYLINNNSEGVIISSESPTLPTGYKLYVSEGILTEKIKVAVKNTSDWRDNVFQDDYKLRSINEVESYIKINRHLPGIPTAEDMVLRGNDLQKTDAILLEKIEEMMLYIIELKKENIKLNEQIELIKNKKSKK